MDGWTVTTDGELPDEHEVRQHDGAARAWDDYFGRILELEVQGWSRDGEDVAYGKRWTYGLRRGAELIRVSIERMPHD